MHVAEFALSGRRQSETHNKLRIRLI